MRVDPGAPSCNPLPFNIAKAYGIKTASAQEASRSNARPAIAIVSPATPEAPLDSY
jgi:hypothetical protein